MRTARRSVALCFLAGLLVLPGCSEAPPPVSVDAITVAPTAGRILVNVTLSALEAAVPGSVPAQVFVQLYEWPTMWNGTAWTTGNGTVHASSVQLELGAAQGTPPFGEGRATWSPATLGPTPMVARFSFVPRHSHTGNSGLYAVWVHVEGHPSTGTVTAGASGGCFNLSRPPFYGESDGAPGCPWADMAGNLAGSVPVEDDD